jgi:hypothetical protein
MPGRRVIQDSDDEDGISPEKPTYSPISDDARASVSRLGSPQQHEGEGDGAHDLSGKMDSTGSTGIKWSSNGLTNLLRSSL